MTGYPNDYDIDIKKWITNIWLVFALDGVYYTILLSTEEEPRAILVPKEVLQPISEVKKTTEYVFFDVYGLDAIQTKLQAFFFERLGLKHFSWTQNTSDDIGVAERQSTWKTYFQGFLIPDSSDTYLICDPNHAYGNQDGWIVSTFLGVQFSELMNRFTVQTSFTKKQKEVQQRLSEEEQARLQDTIEETDMKIQEHQKALHHLQEQIQKRWSAVEEGKVSQRLFAVQEKILEYTATLADLEQEQENLLKETQKNRAYARRLQEKARLQLHFTGLDVTTCPNCDAHVDQDAIAHEQDTHHCRLCGKPAHDADPTEVASLKEKATAIEESVRQDERERKSMLDQIKRIRTEKEQLESELESLQQASRQGISYAQPTPDEEEEKTNLLLDLGGLRAEQKRCWNQLNEHQPTIDTYDIRHRVLEKVKEFIRTEANRLNEARLKLFCEKTIEIAQRIGAESIQKMTCSPVGKIAFAKYHNTVSFKSINNEGERLRIKLAFFLALMLMSQSSHGGYHPRLLLIDQPGSAEMVPEDFQQLVSVFYQIETDGEIGNQVQIICCTARTEAEHATIPSKVYGPQAPPYAF